MKEQESLYKVKKYFSDRPDVFEVFCMHEKIYMLKNPVPKRSPKMENLKRLKRLADLI